MTDTSLAPDLTDDTELVGGVPLIALPDILRMSVYDDSGGYYEDLIEDADRKIIAFLPLPDPSEPPEAFKSIRMRHAAIVRAINGGTF